MEPVELQLDQRCEKMAEDLKPHLFQLRSSIYPMICVSKAIVLFPGDIHTNTRIYTLIHTYNYTPIHMDTHTHPYSYTNTHPHTQRYTHPYTHAPPTYSFTHIYQHPHISTHNHKHTLTHATY